MCFQRQQTSFFLVLATGFAAVLAARFATVLAARLATVFATGLTTVFAIAFTAGLPAAAGRSHKGSKLIVGAIQRGRRVDAARPSRVGLVLRQRRRLRGGCDERHLYQQQKNLFFLTTGTG